MSKESLLINNKKFLEKQKTLLTDELERLKEEIKNLKSYPDNGSSSEDVALEIEQFETALPLEKKLEESRKEIRAALKRIENETYGLCTLCKEQIEEGRLSVMPAARFCSSCQRKKSAKKV